MFSTTLRIIFSQVDFTKYNQILLPFNVNNNHWVLLVAEMTTHEVYVLDSIGADNTNLINIWR